MSELELLPHTQHLLLDPLFGEQDVDATIRLLLEAEYLRRLSQYRRLNFALQRKYTMTFSEFAEKRMTRQLNYVWDVEKDAMDWETAVGGIETIERKLQELRQPIRA